ncbi:hypothetical protein [Actinacidiphila acididurans]|uniref:DUF2716 domain-containing protein n=1 Tax=Actinacidiphila acididurans TaxID=2784346 RepID=A0ABS2TRS5_9ACTN|nr:hypothetical protein [Actinacidiphila acididurans]MBM9506035.1 hypothetical protein [Actinacidiphila acididurans]
MMSEMRDHTSADGSSDELERLVNRPSVPLGPLSSFFVELSDWREVDDFGRKVRSVIEAGVRISREADFDADELPESGVPVWAIEHWEDGAPRYSLHRGESGWTTQDFLYSYDPGRRAWSWWDVTLAAGNIVQVWVDSRGEAVFPCDDLRWAFYMCGARTVVGPLLEPPEQWERQPSVGL